MEGTHGKNASNAAILFSVDYLLLHGTAAPHSVTKNSSDVLFFMIQRDKII